MRIVVLAEPVPDPTLGTERLGPDDLVEVGPALLAELRARAG